MSEKMNPIVRELTRIRESRGEEAFQAAIRNYAKEFMSQGPSGQKLARTLFKDFLSEGEFLALEAEAAAPPTPVQAQTAEPTSAERMMLDALRIQMPGLKTQAQFTAFQATFDALRVLSNAIFTGDKEQVTQARDTLEKGIEAMQLATEITNRLEEVPEAATGPGAEEFKRPPAQFTEYDVQKRLLTELMNIETLSELNDWYVRSRPDIDRVVSQSLRNGLLDAIRERKLAFEAS